MPATFLFMQPAVSYYLPIAALAFPLKETSRKVAPFIGSATITSVIASQAKTVNAIFNMHTLAYL